MAWQVSWEVYRRAWVDVIVAVKGSYRGAVVRF